MLFLLKTFNNLYCKTLKPGKSFPSRYSRNAPPAVDKWVKESSRPLLFIAETVSPPPRIEIRDLFLVFSEILWAIALVPNAKFSLSKDIRSIEKNDIILDIGPKTIKIIEEILDGSNTVMWNGPAGYFENKKFSLGTYAIAQRISENTKKRSLISILGGGDTVSAINKSGLELSFTHLSTAGGAFLEYLEGKDLPGLSVLK